VTDFEDVVADVARMADTCGVPPDFRRMWFDAESDLVDLRTATDAEITRLRRIETAAREVLASGQARYGGTMAIPSPEHSIHEGQYIGDLVPAVAMQALREAVEGEGEVHSG
jgi:hypothetical protein